ncbi:hypothetical protein CR513_19608, partial [Mucuna pruriens]
MEVALIRANVESKSSHECSSSSNEVDFSSNNVNVANLRLVKKLSLSTLVHPRPYKLQWLSENGEMVVDRQVSLSFTLGKYNDEILCDVVSMEATHIR